MYLYQYTGTFTRLARHLFSKKWLALGVSCNLDITTSWQAVGISNIHWCVEAVSCIYTRWGPRHQHGIVPISANSTLILLQKWKYNPSKGFSCQTNSFPKMESLEVARQKRSTASLAGSCWLWSIVGTICCAQLPFNWGIQYRPGMKHQHVDSLSKLPCPGTCSQCLQFKNLVDEEAMEDYLPTKLFGLYQIEGW